MAEPCRRWERRLAVRRVDAPAGATQIAARSSGLPQSQSPRLIRAHARLQHGPPAAQSDFDIAPRDDGAVAVLVGHGELDLTCAHRLGAAINDALAAKPKQLVIDLCNVELVDSAGLAVLVHARRRTLRRGIRLTLVCDVPRTLRVLEITGLDRAFDIHRTRDDALGTRPPFGAGTPLAGAASMPDCWTRGARAPGGSTSLTEDDPDAAGAHVAAVGAEAVGWPAMAESWRACQTIAPSAASAYIATASASPARTSEA